MNKYEDPWTAEIYDCGVAGDWGERDIGLYVSLAAKLPGPVLELACGTGRVTLPLARSGANVTGLDISPHMLAVARRKLAAETSTVQERVTLVQGDMTAFDLGRRVNLVIIPFHAFQALLTRDEQRACLQCCAQHLPPDGRLVINVFQLRPSRLAQGGREEPAEEFTGPDGNRVTSSGSTTFDLRDQELTCTLRYECTSPTGETTVREHLLELRYFFRFEMEWMLEACGFEVEALYGDFDRSEFTAESGEMVFVARRD